MSCSRTNSYEWTLRTGCHETCFEDRKPEPLFITILGNGSLTVSCCHITQMYVVWKKSMRLTFTMDTKNVNDQKSFWTSFSDDHTGWQLPTVLSMILLCCWESDMKRAVYTSLHYRPKMGRSYLSNSMMTCTSIIFSSEMSKITVIQGNNLSGPRSAPNHAANAPW